MKNLPRKELREQDRLIADLQRQIALAREENQALEEQIKFLKTELSNALPEMPPGPRQ